MERYLLQLPLVVGEVTMSSNHFEENLKLFWKYIKERYTIYLRKKEGKSELTTDEILSKYKFTNVFRVHDPGTVYVYETIIKEFQNDLENLIFNCIYYRLYNRVETVKHVGFLDVNSYNPAKVVGSLQELKGKGIPVFTNAFLVAPYAFVKGKDKVERTAELLRQISLQVPEMTEKIREREDSEFTFKQLHSLPGIGRFLGYQIAVDLGYHDKKIYDEDKHVVAGPGCKSGLNRLFEKKSEYRTDHDKIQHLCELQDEGLKSENVENIEEFFGEGFDDAFRREYPSLVRKRLNLMAIENCLCEISKYLKVQYNEGRPRNRYTYKFKESTADQKKLEPSLN